MDPRARLGRRGEYLAARTLEQMGYTIIGRNFRCRAGEIDIIAADTSTVVFCEVKTRVSSRWGAPSESVGVLKQLRVRRAAREWMTRNHGARRTVRFDVISVIVAGEEPVVEHIPDAF